MLTQKVIREEIDELRAIIASGSLVIPSIWECLKPGLVALLLMFICPLIAFTFTIIEVDSEYLIVAVGFSSFIGLMILFVIMDARANILSIPKSFRDKSKVFALFKKKIKIYTLVYIIMHLTCYMLVVFVCANGILFIFTIAPVTALLVFFFDSDVARYQLSAFSEILSAVKAELKS